MRFKLSSLIAFVIAWVLVLPWAAAAQGIQLRVLSNPRPEFVSGGDVLVSLTFPAGVQAPNVRPPHEHRSGLVVTHGLDLAGVDPCADGLLGAGDGGEGFGDAGAETGEV